MALITATEVVNKAFTNANMDTHLIKSTFIEISELNHVKPFLGKDLYNLVANEFNASTSWTGVKNCSVTSGNTTITTSVDDFIKVHSQIRMWRYSIYTCLYAIHNYNSFIMKITVAGKSSDGGNPS